MISYSDLKKERRDVFENIIGNNYNNLLDYTYRLIRKRNFPADNEDVVQDALFITLEKYIAKKIPKNPFVIRSFLYSVIRNKVRSRYNHYVLTKASRKLNLEDLFLKDIYEKNPGEDLEREDMKEYLRKYFSYHIINYLRSRRIDFRIEPLLLKIQGHRTNEISSICGIDSNAVKTKFRKLKNYLREVLDTDLI